MEVRNYLLGYKDIYIYQDTDCFNFSLDSVLLPNFVTLNKNINKILDIGCGNAPIPLILSTKTTATIIGIEIQEQISQLAQKSIETNNLANQIKIINEDINDFAKDEISDSYDIITSNPPFFKVNLDSKFNDRYAKTIARHEVKLNLNQLMKISRKLLKNNGVIAIVHRPDRIVEIFEEMKKNNIEPKKLRFVYPKKGEEAIIVLVEGKKNGKSGLKILSPLFVHNDDGSYTAEVLKYFEGSD